MGNERNIKAMLTLIIPTSCLRMARAGLKVRWREHSSNLLNRLLTLQHWARYRRYQYSLGLTYCPLRRESHFTDKFVRKDDIPSEI